MENTNELVSEYVRKLGLDPSLVGYDYLKDIIKERIRHGKDFFSLSKACEKVGQTYSKSLYAVQRALYFAINRVKDLAGKLSQLSGAPITQNELHPKGIICTIAELILFDLDRFPD